MKCGQDQDQRVFNVIKNVLFQVLADDQSSPLMADLGRSLARSIQPIEDTFSDEIGMCSFLKNQIAVRYLASIKLLL